MCFYLIYSQFRMGFVWGGAGRALVQFLHFSTNVMLCWLFWRPRATLSEGCEWRCCDSICLLG